VILPWDVSNRAGCNKMLPVLGQCKGRFQTHRWAGLARRS
jgi:hypothetical protein